MAGKTKDYKTKDHKKVAAKYKAVLDQNEIVIDNTEIQEYEREYKQANANLELSISENMAKMLEICNENGTNDNVIPELENNPQKVQNLKNLYLTSLILQEKLEIQKQEQKAKKATTETPSIENNPEKQEEKIKVEYLGNTDRRVMMRYEKIYADTMSAISHEEEPKTNLLGMDKDADYRKEKEGFANKTPKELEIIKNVHKAQIETIIKSLENPLLLKKVKEKKLEEMRTQCIKLAALITTSTEKEDYKLNNATAHGNLEQIIEAKRMQDVHEALGLPPPLKPQELETPAEQTIEQTTAAKQTIEQTTAAKQTTGPAASPPPPPAYLRKPNATLMGILSLNMAQLYNLKKPTGIMFAYKHSTKNKDREEQTKFMTQCLAQIKKDLESKKLTEEVAVGVTRGLLLSIQHQVLTEKRWSPNTPSRLNQIIVAELKKLQEIQVINKIDNQKAIEGFKSYLERTPDLAGVPQKPLKNIQAMNSQDITNQKKRKNK